MLSCTYSTHLSAFECAFCHQPCSLHQEYGHTSQVPATADNAFNVLKSLGWWRKHDLLPLLRAGVDPAFPAHLNVGHHLPLRPLSSVLAHCVGIQKTFSLTALT